MNYYFDKTRNIIIAIIIYSYDYCSFNIFKKQNIFNEKNKKFFNRKMGHNWQKFYIHKRTI